MSDPSILAGDLNIPVHIKNDDPSEGLRGEKVVSDGVTYPVFPR